MSAQMHRSLGYIRARYGGPAAEPPRWPATGQFVLPWRTRMRFAAWRGVDTIATWLVLRGRHGTALALWRVTNRIRFRTARRENRGRGAR